MPDPQHLPAADPVATEGRRSGAHYRPIPIGDDAPPDEVSAGPDAPGPRYHRRLRIALAMKGGISLAVWIGGAVAELDVLRRIRISGTVEAPRAYFVCPPDQVPPRRAADYAGLLLRAGYDDVELDLLAGASAGGLNAVMYGVAQRSGAPMEAVLETWKDYGAIWGLLHPPRTSGHTSLLSGDGFFTAGVTAAIGDLTRSPHAIVEHQADRVTIELSATLADEDDGALWSFQRGRGHFRFLGHGDDPAPDAPPTGDSQRWIHRDIDPPSAARLAYAARSTSSFPGAFEPARILSEVRDAPTRRAAGDPTIDLTYAFSHHRARDKDDAVRPFRVIDGGTIDNVPIDRALRAVRDQPARRYGTRAILYLEPDPVEGTVPQPPLPAPAPPLPDRRKPALARMFDVILKAMDLRGVRESSDDEITQVLAFRRGVLAWQGRREGSAEAARRFTHTAEVETGYIRYRATADLNFVTDVLSDIPVWQLSTTRDSRFGPDGPPRSTINRLDDAFIGAYQRGLTDATRAVVLYGDQAVVDATKSALSWLRGLEGFAHRAGGTVMTALVSRSEYGDTRRRLADLLADAKRRMDDHLAALIQAVGRTDDPGLIVDRWLQPTTTPTKDDPPWQELARVVTDLRELSDSLRDVVPTAESTSGVPVDRLDDLPWVGVPAKPGITAFDLGPLMAATGVPDPVGMVRYDSIDANQSLGVPAARPVAPTDDSGSDAQRQTDESLWRRERAYFPELLAARAAAIANGRMRLPQDSFDRIIGTPQDPIHLESGSKLAGSTLGHFGAFLSTEWRINDWWWGRLDAAAGIVRFLESMPATGGPSDTPSLSLRGGSASDSDVAPGATAAAVQDSVLLESRYATDETGGATQSAQEAARRMVTGAQSLSDLRPSYVVSVASRAGRVVLGAASHGRGLTSRIVMLGLLPPILVNIVFVAAPIRLVAAVSIILAAIGVVADDSDRAVQCPLPEVACDPRGWIGPIQTPGVVAAVVGAVLVLLAVGDWFDARSRRSQLVDRPYLGESLAELHRIAGRASIGLIALGAAAFATAVLFSAIDGALLARFWGLCVLGLVALAIGRRRGRRFAPPAPVDAEAVAWVVIALVAVVLMLVAPVFGDWYAATGPSAIGVGAEGGSPFAPALVVGMAAALIAAVMTHGWLGGTPSLRPTAHLGWVVTIVTTALATGGATALVVAYYPGTVLLPPPALAALVAFFVGSHVLWWLGALLMPVAAGASDQPRAARRRWPTGPADAERAAIPQDDGPSEA